MLGNNIKIHFAGSDNSLPHKIAMDLAGCRYRLFTCYPFIKNKISTGNFKYSEDEVFVPALVNKECKHVIMDSGLFTLMFGAEKNKKQTLDSLIEWQDRIVQFVRQNNFQCTCVEVDCQKVLGVEEAWFLRKRMKQLLPNNRIINVFHLEDGPEGLDRLIDFAEYIAISVPELRIHRRGTYKRDVVELASYIKKRKPSIDIHLLGCTEMDILKKCTFCTSADSTSWLSGNRYGRVPETKNHVNDIKPQVREKYRKPILKEYEKYSSYWKVKNLENMLKYTTDALVSALFCRAKYQKVCGPQD